nr:Ycf1 protein [Phlegmariurus squarrosus]
MLLKPHAITLLVLPYMLFYWYRTKDILDNQTLNPIESLNDARVHQIFLDSFILSLLNPVILPSPILARSLNLFIFRYSNKISFVISTFFGWLGGYTLSINLIKLLMVRIERNSSVNYPLIKSIINQIFSIIIFAFRLLYLGRAPVPLFTKKIHDGFESDENQFVKSLWLNKPWPTVLFDYRKWNRPFRYIQNGPNGNSPVKKQVSQYFFDTCSSDGKQRISFTSLPSSSTFQKDLKEYLKISEISLSSEDIYDKWIEKRKNNSNDGLTNRIQALDNRFLMINVTEYRNELCNYKENVSIKTNDPFLNKRFRGKIAISESPWIFDEKSLKSVKRPIMLKKSERKNKLKDWIYICWQGLERKKLLLPWEPLKTPYASNSFDSIAKEVSNDEEAKKTYFKKIYFSEEQPLVTLDEQKISSELIAAVTKNTNDLHERTITKSNINWEHFLNVSSKKRDYYSKYLKNIKWHKIKNYLKKLYLDSSKKVRDTLFLMTKVFEIQNEYQVQDVVKEMPRWTSKLANYKFDVIGITFSDVRYRKLKNFDYVFEKVDQEIEIEANEPIRIVKRFSQQSDFRRNLVIGSMRARRRKTLIWNSLQLKTHSPFFLRIMDETTPLKIPLKVSNKIDTKSTFTPFTKIKQGFIPFFSDSDDEKVFVAEKTELDRLTIANKWDFASAHWGRGFPLVIQSYLRKYVVIPVLIISKNISRILLFQVPEWKEDWNEWSKEIHVKCNYDGTEVSVHQLPSLWHREGLQIKILYPFHLKPWHNSKLKKLKFIDNLDINFFSDGDEIEKTLFYDGIKDSYISAESKKIDYSFLTIWGNQTDSPFGNTKKQPSFWKPVIKEIRKKRNRIFSKITQNLKFYYKFFPLGQKYNIYNESDVPAVFRTQADNFKNNNIFKIEPGDKDKNEDRDFKINNENFDELPIGIIYKNSNNLSLQNSNKNEYDTGVFTRESKNGVTQNSNEIGRFTKYFFDEVQTNIDSKVISNEYPNDGKRLILIKILIKFYQQFIRLRRKSTQLIHKQINSINIFFEEINRNVLKNIFYLIRFKIKIMINFVKNILINYYEVIHSYKNIFHLKTKYDKYVNKDLIVFSDKEGQDPKINSDQSIFLVSQANVFHGVRQSKTINKSYLKNFLKYWNFYYFIGENYEKELKVILDKKGILGVREPQILSEEDWKDWLRYLHICKLPSHIWCKIVPRTWKNEVTKHWKMEEEFTNHFDEDIPHTFMKYSSWERIIKLNRRHKYNLLSYSYLDFAKNREIKKFPMWQSKGEQTIFNNCVRKIRKCQSINNEENDKSNFYFEFKMKLWLFPELMKAKKVFGSEVILIPKFSLIAEKYNKSLKDERLLEDRECYESIYQWKRTSKELERIVKKLRDIAFLTIIMENQENFVSLPSNIVENLEALVFSTRGDETFQNLEFRLPRVFDDQILMYKTISTLLKFKNRFKKRLDLNIFDESIPRIEIVKNGGKTISSSYFNLEDTLLPKRRMELRVLNSPDLKENGNRNAELDRGFGIKGQSYEQLEQDGDSANKNQIIKRFLWPSYRLEDPACMNRFWFHTNNGSRFAMLRICMYPSIHD